MAKRGRKKKKQINQNVFVAVMIVTSILLAVLIYTNSGFIGEHLSPFLGGMMGYIKYILPIGLFALSIYVAYQGETSWGKKILQFSLILLSISIIMNVYEINQGNVVISGRDFQNVLGQFYDLGAEGIGGGAIASIFTMPLIELLGQLGTVILMAGVIIALTISMFGIDVVNRISAIIDDASERKSPKDAHSRENEEKIIWLENKKETKKERRLREQLEKEKAALDVEKLQIKLNGTEPEKTKLFDFDKVGKNNKKVVKEQEVKEKQSPEFIEDPLFKTQEEQKEEKTKEVLQLEHTLTVEDDNYEFPPLNLLSEGDSKGVKGGKKALADTASKLQKTLYSFGVSAKVENVSVGPAITRYELKPAEGVRVSKIANLADDIALNLAAKTIRIEAPIPGKQAVGIEVPNEKSEVVHIRDILESDEFIDNKSKLAFALGKDVSGATIVTDIAKMPHVMIAGATGSGKSVCINTLITSIIYKAKPSEVKLVMVDPKIVELSVLLSHTHATPQEIFSENHN